MSRKLKTWTKSGGSGFLSLEARWSSHERKERAAALLAKVWALRGSGVLFTF